MDNVSYWQWGLILVSSILLYYFSPLAKTADQFFKATVRQKAPNTILLTGSLVISWIFAKSITNAANLGLSFGLIGGLAYGVYYFSFAVAGIVIYLMREKGGFQSIHHFLQTRFGKGALIIFSVLISIRLFNEVWSNTMVIGSYFGPVGSSSYYWAIGIFTLLTLGYALKGGLSSSIFTDAIQMVLFAILLGVILWSIFSVPTFDFKVVAQSGTWSMAMGGNLLLAAFLQVFSYPFHDPVMTDRGFISDTKTTLRSFLWATAIGFVCIVLFSFIGIFAQHQGLSGQAAVEVSKVFGLGVLLVINFIMITSAASTLDSTFSSFSKLIAVDLGFGNTLSFGRLAMAGVAIVGTIPVFFDAEILSATTISGTMVIGLTPVFLFWNRDVPRISFYLSVFCGLFFGILLVINVFPEGLILTSGKYAALLWVNIWGLTACFILFWIPQWIRTFSISAD